MQASSVANAVNPANDATQPESGHVVVCGLGRFGLRIVQLLREQGAEVVVLTDKNTRADRVARALEWGAHLVEGDFRFPDVRRAARVDQAYSLLLLSSADGPNLETALDVRRESPDVRIVMRLESDAVAGRLRADFGIHAVLSPPVLAAAAFAGAALKPPTTTRIPATPRGPRLPRRLSTNHSRRGFTTVRSLPALLVTTLACLFGAGVLVFHNALKVNWFDAIYFTASILTTVGFGDFNLRDQPAEVKLFGTVQMFGGVTLIAVFSSVLTNFFLSGVATQLRAERAARRKRNHVILCGLGNVGFEIAEALLARRVPLVVVDATPDDALARNLSARVPLIVGDALHPEVLLNAGISRARAVISAVSNDAVNLEIGLIAQSVIQEHRPTRPLRIVLRCFDPALAERIHAISDTYTLLSSAEIAAPVFVAEALKTGPDTQVSRESPQ